MKQGILLLCLILAVADARMLRLAVLVGDDHGVKSEAPLKYASRDAASMAALLSSSPAYDRENIRLVRNGTLEEVLRAMREIAGKIGQDAGGTSLLFYFSGHGSAEALHIGGDKVFRDFIDSVVSALPCDIRILILDACESGSFLRSKGMRMAPLLAMRRESKPSARGTVVLTSSSRNQLSHESELHEGSIFTYHLKNALNGAADYNLDGLVSIHEAYHYTRTTVLAERWDPDEEPQNPSYDFDVVGSSDIVLSALPKKSAVLQLAGFPSGTLHVNNLNSGRKAASIGLNGRDTIHYALPKGAYRVYQVEDGRIRFADVDLIFRERASLRASDLAMRRPSEKRAKGGAAFGDGDPGLLFSMGMHNFISPTGAIDIGYALWQGPFQHSVTLGFSDQSEHASQTGLGISRSMGHLAYHVQYPLIRSRFGRLLLGTGASVWQVHQSLVDTRQAPLPGGSSGRRRRLISRAYGFFVPLGYQIQVWPGSSLGVEARTGGTFAKAGPSARYSPSLFHSIAFYSRVSVAPGR